MATITLSGNLPTKSTLFLVKIVGMNKKKWFNKDGTLKSKYDPCYKSGDYKDNEPSENYWRYTDFPKNNKFAILAPLSYGDENNAAYEFEKLRQLSKTELQLTAGFFSNAFVGAETLQELDKKFDEQILEFEKKAQEALDVVKTLKEIRIEISDLTAPIPPTDKSVGILGVIL